MLEVVALLVLFTGVGVTVYLWRRIRLQEQARARLLEMEERRDETVETTDSVEQPFVRSHPLFPWLLGVAVAGSLYFFLGWGPYFSPAFGLITALLLGQLDRYWVARQSLRMETQLTDALDLMVSALRAGATVMTALELATRESRAPLRAQFEELLGRIRLGDDPQVVLKALVQRVPLETFRLFCSALAVHWEVGGSLAPILASVGRVIRDRIEITRRIRSLTAQASISVLIVLGVTYFMALVMWQTDPSRMRSFLTSRVGGMLAAGAIVLQAVGIAWSGRLSRMKY